MAELNREKLGRYHPKPGELIPFEEKMKEFGSIKGDPEIIKKSWNDIEQYASRFIWMCLTDV
jgi:hypothetical protein